MRMIGKADRRVNDVYLQRTVVFVEDFKKIIHKRMEFNLNK